MQVLSGKLRYYLAGPTCPKSHIVGGTVCTQFDLDGVLYAVKGKDLPPQYYHLQPNKNTPNCLELNGVFFSEGRVHNDTRAKHHNKSNKQSGGKRSRERSIPPPPIQHPPRAEDGTELVNDMELSFDVHMEFVHSAHPSPTHFPGVEFDHPPKRLQSRRNKPPPTPSSETWHSKNFWIHLDDVHPEVECRDTEGFQAMIASIAPDDHVITSGEYSYYHKKEKSKVRLSVEAVMLREQMSVMQKDIDRSKSDFERETKELSKALSTPAILKEIIKNHLAFSIRLARLMRQKSTLLEEFAWTHLWSRCIHASVLNGKFTFAPKWRKMTGKEPPTTLEALLANMDVLTKGLDTNAMKLLLLLTAPRVYENDYWIQALSGAHVPWLLASGTRLLHPNTLTAILRSECGYSILKRFRALSWSHDIMITLVDLQDSEFWLPNETALLQLNNEDDEP
ncbi:Choline/Carnitine Oacyltransferase, partial [Phytophthora megakarya]